MYQQQDDSWVSLSSQYPLYPTYYNNYNNINTGMPKPSKQSSNKHQSSSFHSQSSKSNQNRKYGSGNYSEYNNQSMRYDVSLGRMDTSIYNSGVVGHTEYLSFTNQDLIYYGNFNRFLSYDFKYIVRKITRDLNLLLHFRYQDFWAQLKTSETLNKCLRSCLQILPRHPYSPHHIYSPSTQPPQTIPPQLQKSQTFILFTHLHRIVLFIYHRMICQSKQQQKDTIYDEWMFDIPKMFNLIAIYKENNYKIVKDIVDCAFGTIRQYRDDIYDFVSIFATVFMDGLSIDFKFEYTKKIISDSKNFNNAELSFTRNLIKSFFRAYDIFEALINYFDFFPVPYIKIFVSEPDLLLQLIDRYFQYLTNIEGRWEFLPEFYNKFFMVMEKIRQKMIEFFVKAFDAIHFLLKKDQDDDRILRVYFSICYEFMKREESPRGDRWQTLINIIIQENPHRQVFPVLPHFSKYLSRPQLQLLYACQQHEQAFRKQLTSTKFNKNQIIELKLDSIKSYKQWLDFQNFKSFDLMVQDQFFHDTTIKEDSILLMMQSEMFKLHEKKEKKKRKGLRGNGYIGQGWGGFGDCQYEDQPIDDVDEGTDKYSYPFGMEKFQDQEEPEQQQKKNQSISPQIPKQHITNQSQTYEKYYNKNSSSNSVVTQSKSSIASQKKSTKKTYIGYDQLSIAYKPKKQSTIKIEIQKIEPNVKQSIFKKKDDDGVKDKQTKKIEEIDLSISIVNNNSDPIDIDIDDLQNIIDQIQQGQLTIKKCENEDDDAGDLNASFNQYSGIQEIGDKDEFEEDDLSLSYSNENGIQKNNYRQKQEQNNAGSGNNNNKYNNDKYGNNSKNNETSKSKGSNKSKKYVQKDSIDSLNRSFNTSNLSIDTNLTIQNKKISNKNENKKQNNNNKLDQMRKKFIQAKPMEDEPAEPIRNRQRNGRNPKGKEINQKNHKNDVQVENNSNGAKNIKKQTKKLVYNEQW